MIRITRLRMPTEGCINPITGPITGIKAIAHAFACVISVDSTDSDSVIMSSLYYETAAIANKVEIPKAKCPLLNPDTVEIACGELLLVPNSKVSGAAASTGFLSLPVELSQSVSHAESTSRKRIQNRLIRRESARHEPVSEYLGSTDRAVWTHCRSRWRYWSWPKASAAVWLLYH